MLTMCEDHTVLKQPEIILLISNNLDIVCLKDKAQNAIISNMHKFSIQIAVFLRKK